MFIDFGRENTMAIKKRAVASAASEKSAEGVVKINSVEEPKAKQKTEAVVVAKNDETAKKPAAKKSAAKKPAAKKSATAKPIEKKAAAPAAKKPAAKKTAPVKASAEKKAAPEKKAEAPRKEAAKKPAAKAAALKTSITVEFGGRDINKDAIDKAFEGVWIYDVCRKMSEVKSVDFYFKPEESAVYYVTNDGTEGRFEI